MSGELIPGLTRTTLRGEIRRVVFESDDGAFAVLKIVDPAGNEHAVRGSLCGLSAGQFLELEGYWDRHAEFGRQFRVESFRISLPSTAEGIKRYLGSGAIPGIGKKMAALIVDYFGDETLTVLDNNSRRLREVAAKEGSRALLVDLPEELDERELAGVNTLAFSAGASVPEELEKALLQRLSELGFQQETEEEASGQPESE